MTRLTTEDVLGHLRMFLGVDQSPKAVRETAREWQGVRDVDGWMSAGVFTAGAAVRLEKAGVTAEQIDALPAQDGVAVGYGYANGDISLAEIKRRLADA